MLTRRMLLALASSASFGCGFSRNEVAAFNGKTIDGEPFSRDSLKGKPLLIQFWATWCGFCRRDQPDVEAIAGAYRGSLVILAVSVNESESIVRNYLARSPRRSKIVLSKDTNLAELFQPEGFPTYIMINADARKVAEHSGAAGMPGLRNMLEEGGL